MAKHSLSAHCYDKKGQLISCATNSYKKTHPLQAYFAKRVGHPNKIFLHAEIAAIIKAGDRHIHHIHVSRININTGEHLNAAPCPICQEAIKAYGIKLVTHT
jgi:deoxycytidylate deaminase